jgi:N-acetylglutamate synthase-like GNAT family acetyltransferase
VGVLAGDMPLRRMHDENSVTVSVKTISIRRAELTDVPELRRLIEASVLGLQAGDYSPEQLKRALKAVYGVDTQLVADGTYFVAVAPSAAGRAGSGQSDRPESSPLIVGCGGWSRRKTLYGGDQFAGREDSLLDAATDAAKIRAFFVHPAWARRGIGGMILEACESAAKAKGFRRLEMGATLTGVPFYKAKGYEEQEETAAPMGDGLSLPIIRMAKNV